MSHNCYDIYILPESVILWGFFNSLLDRDEFGRDSIIGQASLVMDPWTLDGRWEAKQFSFLPRSTDKDPISNLPFYRLPAFHHVVLRVFAGDSLSSEDLWLAYGSSDYSSSLSFASLSCNDIKALNPRGEKGDKGEKGDRGEPGPFGAIGRTGDKGEPGIIGPMGIQGVAGRNGRDGRNGQPGPPGPMGFKGDKGDKGDPGDSAALNQSNCYWVNWDLGFGTNSGVCRIGDYVAGINGFTIPGDAGHDGRVGAGTFTGKTLCCSTGP